MDALDLDTKFHFHDGKMTVERTQDCTPIAEFTKAKHNAGIYGDSEMKHAARIPYVMIEHYCNKHDITFHEWCANKEHIKRMLNDPDLKAFRVWPGAV
ncbi:hypothetical protein [Pseudomonas multiresinivorans]|uniref:Uncharacterized protein n=1 Tax=Pseudomonas multiresinivorans TaxID=95301 RepID=A0A7Z3GRT0_9PSED|nr:hypothetical protein [Pseudomonas multiresinivorans]QJP10458.1 hypothetical protein G4G71_22160 [Pseudomonas multiresinivorans]